MFRSKLWMVGCALLAKAALLMAADVGAGTDGLYTLPGSWFDFGPGIGVVSLEGNSAGPDTRIERLSDAVFPLVGTFVYPGPPTPGTEVTIDIEIVQLSLRSAAPVFVSGPDSFFDVFIELDSSPASGTGNMGSMTIGHEWADSGDDRPEGTFSSTLEVWADATFAPVGGGPGFTIDVDGLPLSSTGTFWSHSELFGAAGLLIPLVEEAHPGVGLHQAYNPEPASLGLMMFGVLLSLRRRR